MKDRCHYSFAFVVEQTLGHITHGANMREHVPNDPEVEAHWILPRYHVGRMTGKLTVYPPNWTVCSGLQARRELRRLAKKVHLDALFFHTQVPAMLAPDWVQSVPTVISLDATPRQYDEFGEHYGHSAGPSMVEKVKATILRARLEDAAQIVTWSHWAKQGLVDDYDVPGSKITVIPPGVTVDEWRHARQDPSPSDAVRILFVGGDLKRKGGHLLIEAFREVRDRGVELDLVTRSEIAPEPGVRVHHGLKPNSPELRKLFATCDIFALPTLGDCLGMVLMEAGASGAAIVSTRVGAIPEIIIDGETGLLISPGDRDGLVKAILRLVDHPDERFVLGERASAHVARNYDAATNTQRLLHVMKAVVREGERTRG